VLRSSRGLPVLRLWLDVAGGKILLQNSGCRAHGRHDVAVFGQHSLLLLGPLEQRIDGPRSLVTIVLECSEPCFAVLEPLPELICLLAKLCDLVPELLDLLGGCNFPVRGPWQR